MGYFFLTSGSDYPIGRFADLRRRKHRRKMNAEKRRKVLVVSHDTGAMYAYTAIAYSGGWHATACNHHDLIVDAIRDGQIDVLVFDYSPAIGIEALRKVRHNGLWLPAILITAHPVDELEMLNLGGRVILPKPPDVKRLRESLAALSRPSDPAADIRVLFQFLERFGVVPGGKDSRKSHG